MASAKHILSIFWLAITASVLAWAQGPLDPEWAQARIDKNGEYSHIVDGGSQYPYRFLERTRNPNGALIRTLYKANKVGWNEPFQLFDNERLDTKLHSSEGGQILEFKLSPSGDYITLTEKAFTQTDVRDWATDVRMLILSVRGETSEAA